MSGLKLTFSIKTTQKLFRARYFYVSRMRGYILNAMRDIYEIARADEEELLAIAKQRIENFSILKRIYDDDFLSGLVQRKFDPDNLLQAKKYGGVGRIR